MRKTLMLMGLILCNLLAYGYSKLSYSSKPAYIIVEMEGMGPRDSMVLSFWKNVLNSNIDNNYIQPDTIKVGMNKKMQFIFKIPVFNKPGYFIISSSKRLDTFFNKRIRLFDRYLIDPGDSVTIKIERDRSDNKNFYWFNNSGMNSFYKDYRMGFSGNGAEKYSCRYAIDTITAKDTNHPFNLFPFHSNNYIIQNHYQASIITCNQIIHQYKKKISTLDAQIIATDFISKMEMERFSLFFLTYRQVKDTITLMKLRRVFNTYFTNLPIEKMSREALIVSNYYVSYLLVRATISQDINANRQGRDIYDYLKNIYKNDEELRDKLLTLYLVRYFNYFGGLQNALVEAKEIVRPVYCLNILNNISSKLTKGMPAFNFALSDSSGHIVRLSDFKGKVVFMDFWFTGCTACLGLYKYNISKAEDYYKDNPNVIFVSVSIDRIKNRWINSINSNQFSSWNHTNIINLYTGGLGSNSDIIKFYNITGYPYILLIDQKGEIFNSAKVEIGNHNSLIEQIQFLLKGESKG